MQLLQNAFRRTAGSHLTPGRGVLAAISMLLPVLALELLGQSRVGSNAAAGTLLGVLFVAFCDPGVSSLRIRAWAMSAGAVLGAVLVALGDMIGGPWWTAVPALALAAFLGGLLPVYGKVATQVGTILTVVFALALGKDGGPTSAASSALGFLVGGLFFLSLILSASLLAQLFYPQTLPPAEYQPPAPLPPPNAPLPTRSLLIQLAMLRALGVALIAGIAWGVDVPYPHWAPIVVVASVRTDQVKAVNLTIQRIVGTVLGAGLADVVLIWVESPLVLAALAVGGLFLALTVKDVNNTFFFFFLTLLTLFLLNISPMGPTYVILRIVSTLIGALAALGVSWLSIKLVQHASTAASSPPAATSA